jgi:hypothetical protein
MLHIVPSAMQILAGLEQWTFVSKAHRKLVADDIDAVALAANLARTLVIEKRRVRMGSAGLKLLRFPRAESVLLGVAGELNQRSGFSHVFVTAKQSKCNLFDLKLRPLQWQCSKADSKKHLNCHNHS